MRNTQLACFFDTGCLAKNVISCTPGVRFASSLVPQEGFDLTYRNQSRSVDGWSNVTNASSRPGGSSAITSFGHSKRGLLYPVTKLENRSMYINHFSLSIKIMDRWKERKLVSFRRRKWKYLIVSKFIKEEIFFFIRNNVREMLFFALLVFESDISISWFLLYVSLSKYLFEV